MVPKKYIGFLPYAWGLFLWLLVLPFQASGIYGGDSGDLVTAAFVGGVPHPPGYPLFTFLGYLISHISIGTVAWRIGLLSSFFHALTAALVMLFVWRISKSLVAGLFGSLVLVGTYLFFLYSTTPEVFGLLDFFLMTLMFLLYQWTVTKKSGYLLWASFVFGLSLTHHQVILFFVPAIAYWVWKRKNMKGFTVYYFLFTVFGLLPYAYIPIAARGNAIINWDRAVDLKNFLRLVTRVDYGTFVSSGFYGSGLTERIIQVKTYLRFLVLDLTWAGIILGLLGFYWFLCRNRSFGIGMVLGMLFLGPIFFFYASFPLVNRFTLGTYERFLLPSYLFFSIFIGLGMSAVLEFFKTSKNFAPGRSTFFQIGLTAVLFLYPIASLGVTMWRFWPLRNDRTAENLSHDILGSVPQGSILLLQRDTPLFSTQYVRYVLGERSDVKLIHSSRLPSLDYPDVLGLVYPEIAIPPTRGDSFIPQFIAANEAKFPIASITRLPEPVGWFWVPHGLVFLLTKENALPQTRELVAINESLWSRYHDPDEGILARYNHLMLADVRDVYGNARIELGKTLVKAGSLIEAKTQFEKAITLNGDTERSESYVYLGLTELFLKHCDAALSAFAKARQTSLTPQPNILLYEAQTNSDCLGNKARSRELMDEFRMEQKKRETPLEAP